VIAGVCAGIAQALAVDVTLVRLVFALLALAAARGSSSTSRCGLQRVERRGGRRCSCSRPRSLLHAVGLSDRSVAGSR
jgi:hypothetical protein